MSSPVPKRAVCGAGTASSATRVRRKRDRSGAGSRGSSPASRSSTASMASYACRSGAGHGPRWATLPSRPASSCRAQRDQCCHVSGVGSGCSSSATRSRKPASSRARAACRARPSTPRPSSNGSSSRRRSSSSASAARLLSQRSRPRVTPARRDSRSASTASTTRPWCWSGAVANQATTSSRRHAEACRSSAPRRARPARVCASVRVAGPTTGSPAAAQRSCSRAA